MQLNNELYNIFEKIRSDNQNINLVDKEIHDDLLLAKVLVNKDDDDNFVLQQKYCKYLESFSGDSLRLVIAPTYSCNFACPYCYEHKLPNISMSKEVEKDLIDFILKVNAPKGITITWHGGEPLLKYDTITNVFKELQKNEVNIIRHSMVTNGYLLDTEKCEFFKEAKLQLAQITIDGNEETHNKLRKHKSGTPTFQKILNNIDLLTTIIPECTVLIRINISKENKDEFPELYKWLKERYKHKNCFISPAYVTDHGNCNVSCIKSKEKVEFVKELYTKYNIKEVSFYPEDFRYGGCTADKTNSYVIGPKGEMYKCWIDLGKEERIIGSIRSDSYDNWELITNYVLGIDKFNDKKCLECSLFPICNGGCGAFRLEHKLNGSDYNVCPINSEDFDQLLEMHYEQSLERGKIQLTL